VRRPARDRLMVALDVPDADQARALIDRLADSAGVFKIGLELLFSGGPELAREQAAKGRAIFLDAKLLDIGATVERSVANAARLGARFLTIHASDPATLEAAVRGRGASEMKLLAVTVLTSLSADDLAAQGVAMSPAELALKRAIMARECGMDGVVASPLEAVAIRSAVGAGMTIVTPGIRPAGAAMDDQARAATPADAIAAGADYLVVGRPITRSPDPRAAADAIVAEIEAALSQFGK
jgi:orotidine-5'-phosphate decarboxylase